MPVQISDLDNYDLDQICYDNGFDADDIEDILEYINKNQVEEII